MQCIKQASNVFQIKYKFPKLFVLYMFTDLFHKDYILLDTQHS